MLSRKLTFSIVLCTVGALLALPQIGGAEPSKDPAPKADAKTAPASEAGRKQASLSTEQDAITMRYRRFEKTLLRMAEYMRQSDPERADLLIRAIGRNGKHIARERRHRTQACRGIDSFSAQG